MDQRIQDILFGQSRRGLASVNALVWKGKWRSSAARKPLGTSHYYSRSPVAYWLPQEAWVSVLFCVIISVTGKYKAFVLLCFLPQTEIGLG